MSLKIILASQSPYRKRLLERLRVPFETASPGVDEAPVKNAGGSPEKVAATLARLKAEAVAAKYPGCLVIGSDQVAELNDKMLDKPGNPERARQQLAQLSGMTHRLYTAVCILTADKCVEYCDVTMLTMRNLSPNDIERYVAREDASDCVGSYKVEGLGISLLSEIRGSDPTSIEGLGLIRLCQILRDMQVPL